MTLPVPISAAVALCAEALRAIASAFSSGANAIAAVLIERERTKQARERTIQVLIIAGFGTVALIALVNACRSGTPVLVA